MINRVFICLLVICLPWSTWAQSKNTLSEIKDYREVDGKMIITCLANGVEADFVLDLAGHTAILPEYLEKLNIDPNTEGNVAYTSFQNKKIPTSKVVFMNSLSFGNSAFGNGVQTFVLEDEPYLRELGVAGIVGGALFRGVVLTIDSRRKKITMTQPYRPSYMKLDHRVDVNILTGSGVECPVTIGETTFSCVLDTWNKGLIELNENDFARLKGTGENSAAVYGGYGKTRISSRAKKVDECHFVQESFGALAVPENKFLVHSVIGAEILKHGLLSVDYLHQMIYFQPFDLAEVKDEVIKKEVKIEAGKVNEITGVYFRENIHDYSKGTDFIFKGDKPVVIDFWASWCAPCMRMLPLMEQLAAEYKDEVIFLKVNADKEKELCNVFKINALPTLFFLPVNGKPMVKVGIEPAKLKELVERLLHE